MSIDRSTSVGDLARDVPGAPAVFEDVGIDYCCKGARSLAEACAGVGASIDEVVSKLETRASARGEEPDSRWADASLGELMDYIERTHHEFTRRETTRLHALMSKVLRVHGDAHPELAEISGLYELLEGEIIPHLLKEEDVLFPMIRNKDSAATGPIEVMHVEHDTVGDVLRKLRAATHEYVAPADGCGSYRALFDGMRALEADLHRHIHLENNVLFPRVR